MWGAVGAVVAASVAIVAAIIASFQARSAHKQQAAAQDQAASAWRAANAAEEQATEVHRANEIAERAEADRLKEREQARPQLKVTASPIRKIERKSEDGSSRLVIGGLGNVEVTVVNISTRDVTLNHAGITDLLSSATEILSIAGRESLPAVLQPGHQITWVIESDTIQSLVWTGEEDDLPTESEVVVFVSNAPFLVASEKERWYSKPFSVRFDC